MNCKDGVCIVPSRKISELVEEMLNDMCDNYCKYPEQYTEEEADRLYDEHCNDCPMMRW